MLELTEAAVAVLRFRAKGYRMPVNGERLPAFRELVAVGIMEPATGADGNPEADFRFTDDGWARSQEYLDAAEAHLRSLEPRLPDRIRLSGEARNVLARRLEGDQEVTDANRRAYQELANAGIMMPVGTFTKGDDGVFRFTSQGWERRFEWLEGGHAKETA